MQLINFHILFKKVSKLSKMINAHLQFLLINSQLGYSLEVY